MSVVSHGFPTLATEENCLCWEGMSLSEHPQAWVHSAHPDLQAPIEQTSFQ